jgi:hypothetical protein
MVPFEGSAAPDAPRIPRFGRHSSRRRQHRSRPSTRRGRQLLLLIFCVSRAMDVLYYFGFHVTGDRAAPMNMVGLVCIVTDAIWTTALLAGIWHRQNWCRYFLTFFLEIAIFGAVVVVPCLYPVLTDERLMTLLGAGTLVNAAIAWLLITSPDIRRITSKAYD